MLRRFSIQKASYFINGINFTVVVYIKGFAMAGRLRSAIESGDPMNQPLTAVREQYRLSRAYRLIDCSRNCSSSYKKNRDPDVDSPCMHGCRAGRFPTVMISAATCAHVMCIRLHEMLNRVHDALAIP